MSAPYYEGELATVHHGDCLDILRELPDASVDSVVTDPPYGLGFMGKEWFPRVVKNVKRRWTCRRPERGDERNTSRRPLARERRPRRVPSRRARHAERGAARRDGGQPEQEPLIMQRINRRHDPVAAVKATGGDGGLFDLLDGESA